MENASNSPDRTRNGVVLVPTMANFPDNPVSQTKEEKLANESPKVNGDAPQDIAEDSYSSESDALVIDESAPKKRSSRALRRFSDKENGDENSIQDLAELPHSNPFFRESLFELSQLHRNTSQKPKRQLKEYAQYLGLQPAVQFKCPRCSKAGFDSLITLQEHILHCSSTNNLNQEKSLENENVSGFKLTRKVFLCSACGTYYENWNLYVHMLEFHKRYICLYCLGMFSVLEDLCQHIQNRHQLEPGVKNTLEDFYSAYSEPCYVVCCECGQQFNEGDNFFYHPCSGKAKSKVKPPKLVIAPENHVTGDFGASAKGKTPEQVHQQCEINETSKSDSVDCEKSIESEKMVTSNASTFEDGSEEAVETEEPLQETRKVPKLSLKLPKPGSYQMDQEDSDDSMKPDGEVENIESENENQEPAAELETLDPPIFEETRIEPSKLLQLPIAGSDIPLTEIELDQPLDKMDICVLLQKCLKATVTTCIYCNHARRIAVNGRQLALHALAEHRYTAINKSITEEELIPESFNTRIKECLDDLDNIFFNLESGRSNEAVTFSHVFECFQCHYSTAVHKELYLHNRKYHSKNLLLCIMCKSNFYNYSELICHLCPGLYILDWDVKFRCCMCVSDDLPSAFRLMVHLRKRHNVCDVCLEMCHSQYKLSNHVWKHKLHHFCYRCGIAYRNKPDITRHLFWKHGTESVLCKKCLQKKWPHVYHFCVPPSAFVCEECNLAFSKAVSLKVHKRIHSEDKKHSCTWEDCTETFISKKLMLKHLKRHTDPPELEVNEQKEENLEVVKEQEVESQEEVPLEEEEIPKVVKPKVDVYDLPELNLSESDSSSDSEDDSEKGKLDNNDQTEMPTAIDTNAEPQTPDPLDDTSSAVMQGIWDNFKNYQATKEKIDNMLIPETKPDQPYIPDIPIPVVDDGFILRSILHDHDYYVKISKPTDAIIEVKPSLESTESIDHDYCTQKEDNAVVEQPPIESQEPIAPVISPPKKKASSSSESDSDSSCACGSSCSCSDSSSGSSSSSSDSSESDSSTEEGRRRQQERRLKRRERTEKKEKVKQVENTTVAPSSDQITIVSETPISESDLETTESETDEEFYDREPQKFAKKIFEEKRAQLLAELGPNMVPNGTFIESTSRPPTPPAGTIIEDVEIPKKKKKSKKRKKRRSEKKSAVEERIYSSTLIIDSQPPVPPASVPYYQQFHQTEPQIPSAAPVTYVISRNSPVTVNTTPTITEQRLQANALLDPNVRSSKRRRVPNKFYGYSSDEEDKPQSLKRSKTAELNRTIPAPSSPMLVPPITIKAVVPPTPKVEPITVRLPKSHQTRRKPPIPPIRLSASRKPFVKEDSGTESNDSDSEEPTPITGGPPKAPQQQLYCYCRCPYDEVSEMIGCDSNDCKIEWFHFECVGIMVPPKGQWYCPDCRKRKQEQQQQRMI